MTDSIPTSGIDAAGAAAAGPVLLVSTAVDQESKSPPASHQHIRHEPRVDQLQSGGVHTVAPVPPATVPPHVNGRHPRPSKPRERQPKKQRYPVPPIKPPSPSNGIALAAANPSLVQPSKKVVKSKVEVQAEDSSEFGFVIVRLLIGYRTIGCIIGPHGDYIKRLRERANCKIGISDLIPESLEVGRTITLEGERQDVRETMGQIVGLLVQHRKKQREAQHSIQANPSVSLSSLAPSAVTSTPSTSISSPSSLVTSFSLDAAPPSALSPSSNASVSPIQGSDSVESSGRICLTLLIPDNHLPSLDARLLARAQKASGATVAFYNPEKETIDHQLQIQGNETSVLKAVDIILIKLAQIQPTLPSVRRPITQPPVSVQVEQTTDEFESFPPGFSMLPSQPLPPTFPDVVMQQPPLQAPQYDPLLAQLQAITMQLMPLSYQAAYESMYGNPFQSRLPIIQMQIHHLQQAYISIQTQMLLRRQQPPQPLPSAFYPHPLMMQTMETDSTLQQVHPQLQPFIYFPTEPNQPYFTSPQHPRPLRYTTPSTTFNNLKRLPGPLMLQIPSRLLGKVIGQGGAEITRIRTQSQARITIEPVQSSQRFTRQTTSEDGRVAPGPSPPPSHDRACVDDHKERDDVKRDDIDDDLVRPMHDLSIPTTEDNARLLVIHGSSEQMEKAAELIAEIIQNAQLTETNSARKSRSMPRRREEEAKGVGPNRTH